jgi:hypothetical protein
VSGLTDRIVILLYNKINAIIVSAKFKACSKPEMTLFLLTANKGGQSMRFKISKFEVRQKDTDNWKQVTEVTVLSILQKNFTQVSPSLAKMLQGKEIATSEGILRIQKPNK